MLSLYLLRHMHNARQSSISSIADFFNYPESDILRALSYWEKKKVLRLEFDTQKQLCGITFCNLASSKTESVPIFHTQSRPESSPFPQGTSTQTAAVTSAVQFRKPEYSLDQLRARHLRSVRLR